MKIYYSLPSNEGFFNRYASLTPSLKRLSYFAQAVSIVTEVGIIYFIALSRLSEFFSYGAEAISFLLALLLSFTLEVGLRKFVPFSIRAILHKRYSGLDLAMSIFIITVSISLLFCSGFLSFKGSKDLIEIATPPPALLSSAPVDSLYSSKQKEIQYKYRRDSTSINNRYNSQIEAKRKYFYSSISEQKKKIKRYKNKEKETGISQYSSIQFLGGKVAKIKAQRDRENSDLQGDKAQELKELFDKIHIEEELALSSLGVDKQDIKSKNQETSSKAEGKVNRYGGFLAYFSIVCLFCFVFCVAIEEINKRGSGIEEKAIPTPYYFTEGLSASFFSALAYRFNFHAREFINQIEEATPPPVLPSYPAPLFDMSGVVQQRIKVEPKGELKEQILKIEAPPHFANTNTKTEEQKIEPPMLIEEAEAQILAYLRASLKLTEAEVEAPAQEMRLKANDVIKVYLGGEATKSHIGTFRAQVIAFIQGAGDNPFHTEKRQKIGFKQAGEQIAQKHPESLSIQEEKHTVEHNGKRYTMRDVNSFIRTYSTRVKEAEEKDKQNILLGRKETLQYWHNKKAILLNKIND